jgi:hypothetical protein
MENLFRYKDAIFDLKQKVQSHDSSLFCYDRYNGDNTIDENTISIVMTSSNRRKQTLFTLSTIEKSKIKNIQIILVDDSDVDPINVEDFVENKYTFSIDLIKINRETKNWHNPVVNYNIGFQFIKGGKVVIQNAEVCHIGDVLNLVYESCLENNYYVFDVKSVSSYVNNEIIYTSNTDSIEIYNLDNFGPWYQSDSNNRKYHFLCALNASTFSKIKEFSYDYTFGACYDDDDFLLKIISKHITIVNLFHADYLVGGIHLYHGNSEERIGTTEFNESLFRKKQTIYNNTGEYVDATENVEEFDTKYNNLRNTT